MDSSSKDSSAVQGEVGSAGPSSAAQTNAVKELPTFSFDGEEYIGDILSKNVWRKAVQVDGELRWTDRSGTQVGELVPKNRTWKIRNYGSYMLLAPKEEIEEKTAESPAEFDAQAIMRDGNLYRLFTFFALMEWLILLLGLMTRSLKLCLNTQ